MKSHKYSLTYKDCNSAGYDCNTGYGREDEVEPVQTKSVPPHLTEEYLAAQRRAEGAIKMMEESLTLFDSLYWTILWDNFTTSFISWALWLKVKLLTLGVELSACLLAGSILLGVLAMILGYFGPFRIRNLVSFVVAFIIGSTFAWNSIEFAATSIIGLIMWMSIFISRATYTYEQKVVINQKTGNGTKLYPATTNLIVKCQFWYAGSRTLSVNVSEGHIGLG